jgi:hypothetical protein
MSQAIEIGQRGKAMSRRLLGVNPDFVQRQ